MKKDFDIIAITTGHSEKLLLNLLASIALHKGNCKIGVILIKQGESWLNRDYAELITACLHSPKKIALSTARNKGLEHLFNCEYLAKHIIFPDDDSTFDGNFFKVYQESVQANMAYLAKIRTADTKKDYRKYPTSSIIGKQELLPFVASVSLVIPYSWLKKVGHFDEELGAGAKYGSSEDLDYFLRLSEHGDFHFLPTLYNLHPSRFGKYNKLSAHQIRQRFRTYTDGFLHVYFKHSIDSQLGLFAERALAGAVLSLLKLNFTLVAEYFSLYQYRKKRIRELKALHHSNNLS